MKTLALFNLYNHAQFSRTSNHNIYKYRNQGIYKTYIFDFVFEALGRFDRTFHQHLSETGDFRFVFYIFHEKNDLGPHCKISSGSYWWYLLANTVMTFTPEKT